MEYNQMSIEELNNEKERLLKEIDRLNEEIEDNIRLMNDKYIHYLDKKEYEN